MINVTFIKGFVPSTHLCKPHHMTVHEGLYITPTSVLDTFYGTIHNESVYTKCNEAVIVFTATVNITTFQVFLFAKYNAHIQETAFKCIDKCNHDRIIRNIKPSILLFMFTKLHSYWYITHQVHYDKEE